MRVLLRHGLKASMQVAHIVPVQGFGIFNLMVYPAFIIEVLVKGIKK